MHIMNNRGFVCYGSGAQMTINKSLLLYGSVSQGLGTTKFANLIG